MQSIFNIHMSFCFFSLLRYTLSMSVIRSYEDNEIISLLQTPYKFALASKGFLCL